MNDRASRSPQLRGEQRDSGDGDRRYPLVERVFVGSGVDHPEVLQAQVGRITLDNLFIAQNEKDQALSRFVQALRDYWRAYYELRRATLFDFMIGQRIW